MSTCWADEVWGNKLPEGEFAPEYYTGRGEKIEDNAPRFDDSIFDYLSKEITKNMHISGLLTMSGNVLR